MGRIERRKPRLDFLISLLIVSAYLKLGVCSSLDSERRALLRFRAGVKVDPYDALSDWGKRGVDHCFWFGVECSDDGRAVSLNLRDLCLQGTLVSHIARLNHLKSLNLHNNSFSGSIPREISKLQKLEVLDLGHNNLSGPFPYALLTIVSLKVIVVRDNKFKKDVFPDLNVISKEISSSNKASVVRNVENPSSQRLLLQINEPNERNPKHHRHHNAKFATVPSPIPSPSPSPISHPPSPSSPSLSPFSHPLKPASNESPHHLNPAPSPSPSYDQTFRPVYVTIGAGIFAIFSISSMYFICCRTNKVETEPFKTGLSGKLQKALVMGVPSLKRSELQSACEDFSNVIDSLSHYTLYKGTLSSGVEIAVTSALTKSASDWSDRSEIMFKDKISVLSAINHKNFLNLIGYCEEKDPFARMMVYEYAPNGTLFEHLHIKEAEPLNWTARLRIAMGIAYCLDHLLRVDPPATLRSLNSSTVYLTEDYAAKVSDLSFWNEETENTSSSRPHDSPESPLSNREIVYKFGIILLELISGRLPFSKDDGLLVLWASSHLTGKRPLKGIVDQTVDPLTDDDISPLCKIVQSCVNPEPSERPAMGEVVAQLRKITEISPEAATPKLSPLWWAELEIVS